MNYYNEISEGYEELHKEEQEKKIDIIKDWLKPAPNEKLLDVGCGTGAWGASLAKHQTKLSAGVDFSSKMLKEAKKKHPNIFLYEKTSNITCCFFYIFFATEQSRVGII